MECTLVCTLTDRDAKVSKVKREKVPDEDLGEGIQYTFVQDNHCFQTEGATLRYTILFLKS